MIPAPEALQRLKDGNREFVSGTTGRDALAVRPRRPEQAKDRRPFAIILGCSDARVPPEIVFSQGLGDLFVIRVVGNIVTPSQGGSIEYAAEHLGARLVVVLGHSECGAVRATLGELEQPGSIRSRNLGAIVDHVRPSVETLLGAGPPHDREALVRQAVRANVRASVNQLRHGSEILQQLIRDDGLVVVGAEYSLETGVVEFLDE